MGAPPALERDGYVVIADVIGQAACDNLLDELPGPDEGARLRRLLDVPAVSRLAEDLLVHAAICPWMPRNALAVQCTFFDKSGGRNWSVGPHQDLSLPWPDGAKRLPAGWRGASRKDGLDYGQPPTAMLEQVLAVRVQLDDAKAVDGVLEVIPGTHCDGRLDPGTLVKLASAAERVPCPVPRGGALMMRPLLVHGSRRLRTATRRRVLHFVFAPEVAA